MPRVVLPNSVLILAISQNPAIHQDPTGESSPDFASVCRTFTCHTDTAVLATSVVSSPMQQNPLIHPVPEFEPGLLRREPSTSQNPMAGVEFLGPLPDLRLALALLPRFSFRTDTVDLATSAAISPVWQYAQAGQCTRRCQWALAVFPLGQSHRN